MELKHVRELLARREFASAETALREMSLSANGAVFTEVQVLLAACLAKQNRNEDGQAILETILQSEPNRIDAWNWLSVCKRNSGNYHEAAAACIKALEVSPGDAGSYFNLGLCYLASSRFDEAVPCLEKALSSQKNNPMILQNLGVAYQGSGRIEEAATCFKRATQIAPQVEEPAIALGNLYWRNGDSKQALILAEKTITSFPKSVEARILAAKASTTLSDLPMARTYLEEAMIMAPDDEQVQSMLGVQAQYEGDFSQAIYHFAKSVELNPRQGLPYWGLIQTVPRSSEGLPDISSLRVLAGDASIGLEDRSYLYYSIGWMEDKAGNYPKALEAYDQANALATLSALGTMKFDEAQFRSKFEGLRQIFTSEYVRERHDPNLSERPIFIVGMIRSGTTLMEQILSAHPHVAGAGELPFWQQKGTALIDLKTGSIDNKAASTAVQEYLELLDRAHPGFQRVTDKMPDNLLMVGLLHKLIPNAKILLMDRHPVDNCLSIYATPFAFPPDYALNREHIAIGYREQRRLANHWRHVIPTETLMTVSYEKLTTDTAATVRDVLLHCGLAWSDACLSPQENSRTVSTPSVWQARQPVYQSSTERGRRYQGLLPEFERLLLDN